MDKPTKTILTFTYLISVPMFLASIVLVAMGAMSYALTFLLISATWMGMSTLFEMLSEWGTAQPHRMILPDESTPPTLRRLRRLLTRV